MFIDQKKLNKCEKKPFFIKKIGALLILLFFSFSLLAISGTNSFFTDEVVMGDVEFRAGKWIPALTMEISPSQPDGKNGWYKESPCVQLFSDIDDVIIYYSFEGKDIIDGKVAEGVCIYPPEGKNNFSAYAINNTNDEWKSEIISLDFKVGDEPAKPGDVVINELMWMGSVGDADDEWIELRNMTNRDIDLSNWNIMFGGSGQNGHIEIPHGYSIKANGYFLITAQKWKNTEINLKSDLDKTEGYTNVSGMNLKNDGELLILENKDREAIDTAWQNEKWTAGLNEDFLHASMERNDEPGNGTLASSWHTCVDEKCNDKEYWKEEGFNFGTPGQKNSTESDSIEKEVDNSEEEITNETAKDSSVPEEITDANSKEENLPNNDLEIPLSEEDLGEQNNTPLENEDSFANEDAKEIVIEEEESVAEPEIEPEETEEKEPSKETEEISPESEEAKEEEVESEEKDVIEEEK